MFNDYEASEEGKKALKTALKKEQNIINAENHIHLRYIGKILDTHLGNCKSTRETFDNRLRDMEGTKGLKTLVIAVITVVLASAAVGCISYFGGLF